ncbi:MAG TPA: M23 family metallopeptidase [Gemmatimonadales bacterium]|jgi:murein DD-endopeptidase MepM/ murein hydrolase activator NlpD|nr:M23 family metallopeptidase [Gemmatimonadales bacterium]
MSERRWRVVVVPPGSGTSKVLEVSQDLVKLALGVGLVCVLVALLLGYTTVSRTLTIGRHQELVQQNRILAEQLGQLQDRVGVLADTLNTIQQRSARIRLLANLDPIDPQVQAAGIGGPSFASASDVALRSAGVLGTRAATVKVDVDAMIRRADLLAASFAEAADSLQVHSARLAATPSIMPTNGWLTSAFTSMRMHPILHVDRPHEGIDVVAPMGSPIEAPAAGVVTAAGWETGYGNRVTIDHGYGIVTKYAHCSRLMVRVGQRVQRGQQIALVGSTGLATGPHLHYEVHVDGKAVDPLRYVLPDVIVD